MAFFQLNFFSPSLRRSVPVNILIPCDLGGPVPSDPNHPPYKTLYLLNGYFGDCTSWLLEGDVMQVSLKYDIAIVMPSGDNSYYTNNPYYEHLYSDYISRDLVNYTRSIFPLSDKREDTYIGGFSMGGFGALYNSLKNTDVFGHVIALSTPFKNFFTDVTDEPNEMGVTKSYYESLFGSMDGFESSDANLFRLAEKALASGNELPELYIACGYNDMLVHGNRDFHRALTELGIRHTYEEGAGTHEFAFWTTFLKNGLEQSIKLPENAPKHPFWIERDNEGVI